MLNAYRMMTQRLLREQRQPFVNTDALDDYINRARREVANRTSCVRVTPPISGSLVSATVASGGSGYTNPTVTITSPDFPSGIRPSPNGAQATANAMVNAGAIVAVNIDYGGSGYFQPIITISDPTGSGAVVTPNLTPMTLLNMGQERYDFSAFPLGDFPGVRTVIGVRSVSIIYANYRYSLPCYAWSVYQAMIRQYPFQYQYVPTFCSQFGQGANGTLFMYPLPSQTYQFEVDCTCQPSDLTNDYSEESIPQPWQDCVPFLSAYFGFLEIQNMNAAKFMRNEFESFMLSQSQSARIGRVVNPYGRY